MITKYYVMVHATIYLYPLNQQLFIKNIFIGKKGDSL